MKTAENSGRADRCRTQQRGIPEPPVRTICLFALFSAVNYGTARPNKDVVFTVYRDVVAYGSGDVATLHRAPDRSATRVLSYGGDRHGRFRMNGEDPRYRVRREEVFARSEAVLKAVHLA